MSKRILVGDIIDGEGKALAHRLSVFGLKTEYCSNNLMILEEKIVEQTPDGLVFYLTRDSEELYSFVKRMADRYPDMKIFAVAHSGTAVIEKKLKAMDINTLLLMPATENSICRSIMQSLVPQEEQIFIPEIESFLIAKGFSNLIIGFVYLCVAVELCICNPRIVRNMMSEFYPLIADKTNSTTQVVERSLRHLSYCSMKKGMRFDNYNGKYPVPNRELIIVLSDEFAAKYNIYGDN